MDDLLQEFEKRISGSHPVVKLQLGPEAMKSVDWLYENTQLISRTDNDDGTMHFEVRVMPALRHELMGLAGGD